MDPSGPSIPVQLGFLVFLTLINAFFASAEMAFVSANKNRIKILANEGNKKAQLLQVLLEEPTKFLSTIQVAITFAGFLSSASAATGMADDLGTFLSNYGVPYSSQLSVVLVTMILSYFTLVFGELFPKRLAMQNADKLALLFVRPVFLISRLLSPFVAILSMSIAVLMKLCGRDNYKVDGEYSEEEVKSMLDVGTESGQLDEAGREMIESVFDFDDELAYEIMTPRTDVYMIDINDPLEEYLDELLEERYSRIPVYDEDSDDIIGILYMKDFIIEARKVGFEHVDIRPLLQKPYFVPESKKINELFDELQRSRMHIAMLIDEYGGFSGIVTTEDIIEEIVGSLDDEYDDNEPQMEQLEENIYLVDGQYPLDDISDELEIHLDSENHETIGGLIIELLGEIPDEEEDEGVVVEYENYTFTIVEIKDRRIEKLKMEIHKRTDDEDDTDEDERDDD
ncbi:MAG: HlyC/CorC family transporter [Firmicutes bacterium]|nr:HlyC/CorC family transporter [Bacillota bacterium]MBR7148898.1 HlyC/CorC family transporter [Bacillota bacterium]